MSRRMSHLYGAGRSYLVLLAATLALVLALPDPANAQSASASASPGASQYDPGASVADATGDVPPAISDNVTGGADVVNDAIRDDAPDDARDDAPDAAGDDTSNTEGSASAGSAEEELLVLPETGGAPLASVCAGASLLGFALLLLRSRLRKA